MAFTDLLYSVASLHRLFGKLLAWYVRLLGRTCHYKIIGQEYQQMAMASGRPILYVAWHQQHLLLDSYGWKFLDLSSFVGIVEGKNRGNIWLNAFYALGVNNVAKVDMEGNPVLAGRRLIGIIRALRNGKNMMVTPDGPYGPSGVMKPGTMFFAKTSDAIIIPCGSWTTKAFKLKRWDGLLCAFPYSQLVIVFREPIRIADDSNISELEYHLTQELNAARNRAQVGHEML